MVDHAMMTRPTVFAIRVLLGSITVLALAGFRPGICIAAEERMGEQVYQQQCLSCHGKHGEGSKTYGHPLEGDKSVGQLTKYIAKSMPDDDPGACVGDDARKVAEYIYEAFYSKTAQARNQPARIELSRLTVRQYQNTIADLIGSFREQGKWGGPKGLHGEYFKSQRFRRKEDRIVDRVDPTVEFDFGVNLPDGSKTIGHRYAIFWEGSIMAPETGEYEFIIRTDHSARLWVNDTKKPLIDHWVKSGNDTEFRESIRLLGGRAYPIRLEFSKGKHGDKDGKKDPDPPPTKASIALLWKPPQQAVEVIPQRSLSPGKVPETYVLQAAFPPDDRSVGYERGSSISKAWDQAATDAGLEVGEYVSTHLAALSGAKDDARDREARVREFCRKFAERAFRRPLSDEQRAYYIDRQLKAAKTPEAAAKRVVLAVLKSPRFLYHEVNGALDGFDVACRISFGLWDSLPDQALEDAAAAGKLATRDQVARQAERMLPDPRTRSKIREFLLQWLKVDRVPDVSKDPKLFPQFTPAIASDLRTSLDLFLADLVWSEGSDFRRLLQADELFLNGRLAKFYGANLPAEATFQKVKLDEKERAGLLTHPYLMATFAYTASTSPIHRGVFISRGVLGRTLRPPPEAVAPLSPDLHASLTTRERVMLQTSPKSCQMCHGMINPLGYTLEHFDTVGRYRKEEKGRPIDSTGTYQSRSGESVTFTGARDLASFLVRSEETHTAFVQQLFHYLVKQPVRAFGSQELTELREYFEHHDFNMQKLMVEIVATSALTPREAGPKTQGRPIPVAARR
jgi:mono/diheme cytochrome c family protein